MPSLLSAQSLANAEIKVIPPPNWQPSPYNNSTVMAWFQNSTKSIFAIIKVPEITFPLFFIGPIMAQFFADKDVLASMDQISFGRSNYGYRYFLNLPLNSTILNFTSNSTQESNFLSMIPRGTEVPMKMMLILTQKQDDLYAIIFLSAKENFDSMLNEIKPTLDSIQLSNSTSILS
jgi:hypothetical protein